MKKLTIAKGNDIYEILVQDIKYICGENDETKFDIIRSLSMYFNDIKSSEYAEEKNNIAIIYLDEQKAHIKNSMYFYVHKYYSLAQEYKLPSKSLLQKYFETLLGAEEFSDTIQTLNYLFESLSQELNEYSAIDSQFTCMVPKQLLKILTPAYMEDFMTKNEFDFTSEEIILLQLELIKYIVEHQQIEVCIICVEISRLTQSIYKLLKQIKNAIILVVLDKNPFIDRDIEKYYLCEQDSLDLGSDEDLYTKICDNDYKLLTLEEGKIIMENYLFNNEHKDDRFIQKILMK